MVAESQAGSSRGEVSLGLAADLHTMPAVIGHRYEKRRVAAFRYRTSDCSPCQCLSPRRPGEGGLGLDGQRRDHGPGRSNVSDEVDPFTGPYRDDVQIVATGRFLISPPGLGISTQLVLPPGPAVEKRIAKGRAV